MKQSGHGRGKGRGKGRKGGRGRGAPSGKSRKWKSSSEAPGRSECGHGPPIYSFSPSCMQVMPRSLSAPRWKVCACACAGVLKASVHAFMHGCGSGYSLKDLMQWQMEKIPLSPSSRRTRMSLPPSQSRRESPAPKPGLPRTPRADRPCHGSGQKGLRSRRRFESPCPSWYTTQSPSRKY